VTALLPVWGTLADSVSVAWLPIGVATITAGIFDHRALVRAPMGPPRAWGSRTAMSSRNDELLLDRLIHEPGRLAILTVLSSVNAADFVFLQRTTGLTKGNLSSHLTKLEEAGLVEIEKRPSARSPTPTSP